MNGGWRTVRLGDVLTLQRRPVAIEDDREYQQVTVRIRGRGLASRGVVAGSRIATKRQFEVSTGQLVTSKIDARNGGFGLVPPELDGAIVSGDFLAFQVDEATCLPDYLDLYVRRPSFWEECELVSEGSTNRVRLVPEQFLDIEVDLPTLAEQQRIVAAVAVVNRAAVGHGRHAANAFAALRAAREELLATDEDWDELPDGWRRCQLVEVADIRSGITKGRKTRAELREVPFIRAANVQDGFLDLAEVKTLAVSDDERERFSLQRDDILMTEGGNAEHVGRGWLWEDEYEGAVCQNHVFRVRVERDVVLPRYLAYVIGASPARAYCLESAKRTTNLASINKTQVSEMVVPVPPLGVQDDIVRKLDALRRVGVAERRAAERLTRVRAALVEELLSGERNVADLALAA